MIRSIFLDIDGTLVSFKTHRIPQSAVDALTAAKQNGVKIFISTGRPVALITNLKQIEHLIDGYITTNGALCMIDGKTICRRPIPADDVWKLLADADKHDYTCLVTGETEVVLYNPKEIFDKVFRDELNVTGIDSSCTTSAAIKGNVLQFSPFFDAEHEREIMPTLQGCVSGRWHPAFTDITSKEADKGKGLETMAEYLGLDISETMALGDGGNDISILQRAGIGVAMGNAGENVKLAADYVTSAVDEDGVMNALKHFNVI